MHAPTKRAFPVLRTLFWRNFPWEPRGRRFPMGGVPLGQAQWRPHGPLWPCSYFVQFDKFVTVWNSCKNLVMSKVLLLFSIQILYVYRRCTMRLLFNSRQKWGYLDHKKVKIVRSRFPIFDPTYLISGPPVILIARADASTIISAYETRDSAFVPCFRERHFFPRVINLHNFSKVLPHPFRFHTLQSIKNNTCISLYL